tara:strand:- start:245 stop:436 length:192 start_codon:yes stop_codon:yes gene_type:complete
MPWQRMENGERVWVEVGGRYRNEVSYHSRPPQPAPMPVFKVRENIDPITHKVVREVEIVEDKE